MIISLSYRLLGLGYFVGQLVAAITTVFDKECLVHKATNLLLRIQFTYLGFTKYATTTLGYDEAYAPMFYKITYSKDTSGTVFLKF